MSLKRLMMLSAIGGVGGVAKPLNPGMSYNFKNGNNWQYPSAVIADADDFTIEFLYMRNAISTTPTFFEIPVSRGKDGFGDGWNIFIAIDFNNKVDFSTVQGGSMRSVVSPEPIELGEIYHIAATHEYVTGVNKLFIDGLEVGMTESLPGTPLRSSTVGFSANYMHNNNADYWLSNLRVWDIIRTQEQILSNMSTRLTPRPGLLLQTPFNEGAGLVAKNNINNIAGTLNSDAGWGLMASQ